jgi:tetratricopeptide (TPR) repeat protein
MKAGLLIFASFLCTGFSFQPSPAALRQLFEDALARRRSQFGDDDIRTAQAARDLGLFLRNQGDASGARRALAEVVRIDEKVLGPKAAQTLADVAELAGMSPPPEAEPLWQRAAQSSNAALGSRALASLGQLHEASGDTAGAANFYRRALAKEEDVGGPQGAQVPARLNALAQVVDVSQGIALLERALAISRRGPGARNPDTAMIELNLATLQLRAGRTDQAAQSSRDAISIFEETLGADHPRVAAASMVLAAALRSKKDAAGAEKMYRRALEIDEEAYGPLDARTVHDARTLAQFLREIGKSREAAALEKRLLSGAR